MDERADGRGAFHRIGQPDVQRDLPGFAGRTAEDEDADSRGEAEAEDGGAGGEMGEGGRFERTSAGIVEEQRVRLGIEPDHAKQKSEIADAGDYEGLFRGGRGLGLGVPEADEQVGG